MKKSFFRVTEKLTPSGFWDNGVYEKTNEKIIFPAEKLKTAIIENVKLKASKTNETEKLTAIKMTIDGRSYLVK